MSIETAIRMICDTCKQPSESHDGSTDNHPHAMRELRAAGWVSHGASVTGFAGDMCPGCVAKFNTRRSV